MNARTIRSIHARRVWDSRGRPTVEAEVTLHDGAVGMGIAEGGELIDRTAEVERAGRIEIGHQHRFIGRQNLCCLAHEAHASHHQGLGRMVATEACHLQRIGHAAAGLFSQVLQFRIDVVMRDQHRLLFLQQAADLVLQRSALRRRQRIWHACPGGRDATGALAGRSLEFNSLDFHACIPPCSSLTARRRALSPDDDAAPDCSPAYSRPWLLRYSS